jgi:CRP-like cAMP-binding protein
MQITQNRLLLSLSEEALAALGAPQRMDLPLKADLDEDGYVYFLESGIASIVAKLDGVSPLEIGIIGAEGTSALSTIYQDAESPFQMYMQIAGTASRFEASRLSGVIEEFPEARSLMLRFARAFSIQVATTAFANGRAKVDARLARWLLMASDRVGPTFSITHEFLSMMLGVRRAGVTLAMQDLEGLGLVRAQRGTVTIRDRGGLIELTGGAYGFAELQYERLLGAMSLPFYRRPTPGLSSPLAA